MHKDGDKHFHVVLKQDIRNVTTLQIEFEGKSYRCKNKKLVKYNQLSVFVHLKYQKSFLMPLLGNVADNEGIDMALQFLDENQLK